MDALDSFTHLDNIIPDWLSAVTHLVTAIPVRQQELYDIAHRSRDPTPPREPKKISASINETIRSGDDDEEAGLVESAAGQGEGYPTGGGDDPARGRTIDPTGRYSPPPYASKGFNPSQTSKRKRKNASVQSHASGRATKFRHRLVGVVFYDGETQETLSKLHAQISAARNNLRKGRREAQTKRFLSDGSDDSDDEDIVAKLRYVRAGGAWNSSGKQNEETDPYSVVDRLLEDAQGLTERAAHQVIRDGECDDEIDNIQKRLTTAKTTAGDEYAKLVEKPRVKEAMAQSKLEQGEAAELKRRRVAGEIMDVDLSAAAIEVDPIAADDESSYAAVFAQMGKGRARREPLVRRRTSSLRKGMHSRDSDATITPGEKPATPAEDSIASRTRMARMKQAVLQQHGATAGEGPQEIKQSAAMSIDEPIEVDEGLPEERVDALTLASPTSKSAANPIEKVATLSEITEVEDSKIEVDNDGDTYDLSAIMSMTRPRRGGPNRQPNRNTARTFEATIPERSRSRNKKPETNGGARQSAGLAPPPATNKAPSMEMHLD